MAIFSFSAFDFATGNLVGQTEAGGPPAMGGLQVQTRPVVDFLQDQLGLNPAAARVDIVFRDQSIRDGDVDSGNPNGDGDSDQFLRSTTKAQQILIDADGDGIYDYEVRGQNGNDMNMRNGQQEGDYLGRFNGNLNIYRYDGVNGASTSDQVGTLSQGNMFVSSNGAFGEVGTITPTYDADNSKNTFVLPCFVSGTRIVTPRGLRRVEDIAAGDLIVTRDHGLRAVQWAGGRHLTAQQLDQHPELSPILICAGTIGNARSLVVSPQHRILMNAGAGDLFATDGPYLVPAIALLDLPGVRRLRPSYGVSYHHLLFAQHEIIFGDGVPSESLQPGSLTDWILPHGFSATPMRAAYPTLTGTMARRLVAHGAGIEHGIGQSNRPMRIAG